MHTEYSNPSKLEYEDLYQAYQVSIEQVSALKQWYKALYDGAPILLRTINKEGIILDCNESYARSLGFSKKELIGTSIFETVADESIDLMRDSFVTWKNYGFVRNREIIFKRKNGTTFPVLINANNLYDEEGNLIGSNTVIQDISYIYADKKFHRQLTEQLEKCKTQLDKEVLQKNEFVNMITNELRAAAFKIKADSESLLKGSYEKEPVEDIKIRSRSIIKMLDVISEIQKIENDQLRLVKGKYDLSKIITYVISKLDEDAKSHGCIITTDLLENVFCLCDGKKIEEVLTHLITNAIDFSPKYDGKINIELAYEGKNAKIVVKDNGIGIKKENLERIFGRFYQVDTLIIREHAGAGLDMYICKKIIEMHEGKIWAESKGSGTGAEIHVILPLFKPEPVELRKVR